MITAVSLKKVSAVTAMAALVLALLSLCPDRAQAVYSGPVKHILVLASYHRGYKWTDDIIRGIDDVLRSAKLHADVHWEYMDTKRHVTSRYVEQIARLYDVKYANTVLDVIICSDNNAFNFLKKYRDRLFPGVPVVFCGINYAGAKDLAGFSKVIGVSEEADLKAGLDLALKLHPQTKLAVLISDQTTTGRRMHEKWLEVIPQYKDRLKFVFLEDVSMAELQDKVRALPLDSLAFYSIFFRDRLGDFFEYDESIALIARECPVPVYGYWDFSLGYGIVGGMLTSGYSQGKLAAELAVKVVRGQSLDSLPKVSASPNRYMFDYKQLSKFGIPLGSLPPGSEIINRPKSFYEQHRRVIWGSAAGMAVMGLTILILAINVARRRNAEKRLLQANLAMEKRVEHRTTELAQANLELKMQLQERRRAQKATQDSERRLAEIIDFLPDATFVIDQNGVVMAWNRAMESMTGVMAAEMLGRGDYEYSITIYDERRPMLIDLVNNPDPEAERFYTTLTREGDRISGETQHTTLDDGSLSLWATARPLYDSSGKVVGAVESIRDITERRLAQRGLRQSEAIIRTFFDNAPVLMGLVELGRDDLRYVSVNQATADFLGLKKNQVDGRLAGEVGFPIQPGVEWLPHFQTAEQEQRPVTFEYAYRLDTLLRQLSVTAAFVGESPAGVHTFCFVAEDISRRGGGHRGLVRDQRMEALGRLSSGLAREMRGILRNAAGNISFMRDAFKELDEFVQACSRVCLAGGRERASQEALDSLAGLVSRSDFGYLQKELPTSFGKSLDGLDKALEVVGTLAEFSWDAKEQPEPTNLVSCVDKMLNLTRSQWQPLGKAEVKADPDMPLVVCQPNQIKQVFMVLILNAARSIAARDGHGARERGRLEINLGAEDSRAVIKVSDNGAGMSPAVAKLVFDYAYVPGARYQGKWLGLSAVREIVEQGHQGEISVESEPGAGTTFTVRLPIQGPGMRA